MPQIPGAIRPSLFGHHIKAGLRHTGLLHHMIVFHFLNIYQQKHNSQARISVLSFLWNICSTINIKPPKMCHNTEESGARKKRFINILNKKVYTTKPHTGANNLWEFMGHLHLKQQQYIQFHSMLILGSWQQLQEFFMAVILLLDFKLRVLL